MKSLNKYLKENEVKSLMGIFAHPDDESFLAGGLFQVAKKLGIKTHLVCLTKGEKGKNRYGNGDLKQIRKRELENAVNILSISKLDLLDYPDAGLNESKNKWKKDIKKLIKESVPDVIVTFDLSGITGHPDHIISAYETLKIVKKENDINLFWRTPSSSSLKKFKDNKALKYRVKPTYELSYSPLQLVNKYRAIFAHKCQIQDIKHVIRILKITCNLSEPFYKVDLTKKYEYELFPFEIE